MLTTLTTLAKNRTTYRVGLLQDKAYRALKNKTTDELEQFGITTTEWAFLGLIMDTLSIQPGMAADELGIEAPFVTTMARKLIQQGHVREQKDESDSRRKNLSLTQEGTAFVTRVEAHMRSVMRPLISGVSPRALASYLVVLGMISSNARKERKA